MQRELEPGRRVIAAWKTNNRATMYLVEHLPLAVWSREVPGISRQRVGMIAAHIHNGGFDFAKARRTVKIRCALPPARLLAYALRKSPIRPI